jgi:aspartate carbamoyltransferase catalytic subunit
VRDVIAAPVRRPVHLASSRDLDRTTIDDLLVRARRMATRPDDAAHRLQGKILASLFYEPSTRTRFSFESAMLRLGGQVLTAADAISESSAAKGETLEDTVRVVAEYVDGIVLRHPEKGAARRAADASRVPVINAGDGTGEHPTQALLDLFTIQQELGRLDHLRVGLAGDLRHGRTARSLALLLALFPGTELVLIAPPELQLEADVRGQLREAGVTLADEPELGGAIGELDVLYQTRIQRERFASPAAYERVRGIYVVDQAMMRRLPPGAILMHPLPRLDEITTTVDADPRAAYFRQARNGLPVRMAILDWLLGAA